MYGLCTDAGVLLARFVTPLSLESNEPVFSADSLSLKRSTISRTSQRWEIRAGLEPLSYTNNALFAFLVKKGLSATFKIRVPQPFGSQETRTVTGALSGSGTANSDVVNLGYFSGTLPIGTMVKFSNHNKVYMITDVSGSQISVFPKLVSNVSGATMYYKDDVIADFYRDGTSLSGMSMQDGILMSTGELKFIEKL